MFNLGTFPCIVLLWLSELRDSITKTKYYKCAKCQTHCLLFDLLLNFEFRFLSIIAFVNIDRNLISKFSKGLNNWKHKTKIREHKLHKMYSCVWEQIRVIWKWSIVYWTAYFLYCSLVYFDVICFTNNLNINTSSWFWSLFSIIHYIIHYKSNRYEYWFIILLYVWYYFK